jgi:hypothetical protein
MPTRKSKSKRKVKRPQLLDLGKWNQKKKQIDAAIVRLRQVCRALDRITKKPPGGGPNIK